MLQKNQTAPDFDVPNQDKQTIHLSDYQGSKNIVLYFYPKDDTPGCTVEGQQFTNLADDLRHTTPS